MDEAKTYYDEMLKLREQNDRLRAAVNTALMHMIGYVNPNESQECLKRVLRAALQDADR